jgi:hypothetical protein
MIISIIDSKVNFIPYGYLKTLYKLYNNFLNYYNILLLFVY